MVTETTFIEIAKELRAKKLFRAYRMLSEESRALLDSSGLPPKKQLFAIAIYQATEFSLARSIRKSKSWEAQYNTWYANAAGKDRNISEVSPKESQAIREFLHQGFIPLPHNSSSILETIKRGIRRNKLNTKLSYLVSNTLLDGNIYLLPKGFWFSYYQQMEIENNGYIYKALSEYGVPGYTRAFIPEG